jgi:hypothetical protein
MAALLVGMGALLLAVIVSALLDPWPAPQNRGGRAQSHPAKIGPATTSPPRASACPRSDRYAFAAKMVIAFRPLPRLRSPP